MSTQLQLHVVLNTGLYIDYNRNQLVDVALNNGSTHMLFIDSDIKFDPDAVDKLLAHDKDIVGGYYNTRRGNCPVRIWDTEGKLTTPDPLPTELFQCAVLPTGFMLIKLACLEHLQRPYFQTITHANGTIGEDVVLCRKLTEAGIDIWCDPTFTLGHVSKKIY